MTTPPAADPGTVLRDATAAMRQGNLPGAAALAAAAEARFRARGDADGRMRAENLLGAVAFETGQVGEAERFFGTALELAHGLDDSLMTARASNNLASVAHLTGRPELALSLYRTALLSYQRLGDRRGMAETSHNLGIAFRQLRQWTEAERAAEQAVRHADQLADAALRGLALVGLAELHLELKAWPLAEREIDRAAALAAEGDDPIGVVEAARLRALLEFGQGNADAALRERPGRAVRGPRPGQRPPRGGMRHRGGARRAPARTGRGSRAVAGGGGGGADATGGGGTARAVQKRLGRLIGAPFVSAGQCPCSSLCSSATRAATSGGASTYPWNPCR